MVAWFFKTPIQTQFSPGYLFMAKRPAGKAPQERYHTGLDIDASEGQLIYAPEACTIIDANRGWQGSALATLLHTDSGKSLLLGCTALNGSPPEGTRVPEGGVVGAVGYYTKENGDHSSMLHFQAYDQLMSPLQVNSAQAWYLGQPKPQGLIDPLEYLSQGVSPSPAPAPSDPAGLEVEAEGGLTGTAPCPLINGQMVCLVNEVQAWRNALDKYNDQVNELGLQAATMAFGEPPTRTWTPAAEDALNIGNDNRNLVIAYDNGELSELPNALVQRFVTACQRARWAIETYKAFIAGPAGAGTRAKSSGGLLLAGGIVLLGAGAAAAAYAMRSRKRRAA